MDDYTATAIHESGHAVVWLLEEEHLGPPEMISALPDGEFRGLVASARGAAWETKNPRVVRAIARMRIAGGVARALAGDKDWHLGIRGDTRALAAMEMVHDLGERYREETIAGAELMLRTHWGAVEGIAGLLKRIGVLTEPHGIALARAELARRPMRQLAPDFEGLARLLVALQHVPEFGEAFKEELCAMLPPAAPAKAVRPPGARSRLLSRSQPRSFRRVSGDAIG